ncbi:MAG: ATP-binding cassette domain-containing protein, partial [Bacteroidota bacterium]
ALQIVLGLTLLSFYHPFFIIFGILLVALLYGVFRFTATKALHTSLVESRSKYRVAHWLQEVARSLLSFKLSGNTSLAMARNDNLTAEYLQARETHFRVLLMQFAQMIGFKIIVTAGLLIIGGLLVLNQQMNIGQFVAAEIIILLVINSVEKLIYGLETFYDVLTSLEKIGQVVDKGLEEQGGMDPFEVQSHLRIHLENVEFTTKEGKNILNNINLDIVGKDRIMLNGSSGSGRTTLLKLLSGLLFPSSGNVFVNDVSMEGIWPNKYRSNIGQVVPEQSPFEGSILENITFDDPSISQERLNDVLKHVGLLPFIKEQPNGIHTILYPEGQRLPYTVSKSIILARAIIHEPKLLLLKDPLEHFEVDRAEAIIDYLTHPDRPWALVVSSRNDYWKRACSRTIQLTKGTINTSGDA